MTVRERHATRRHIARLQAAVPGEDGVAAVFHGRARRVTFEKPQSPEKDGEDPLNHWTCRVCVVDLRWINRRNTPAEQTETGPLPEVPRIS